SLSRSAAEGPICLNAFEHGADHLVDEDGLEILGYFCRLVGIGDFRIRGGRFRARQRRGDLQIDWRAEVAHPITSISACSAPAALIACRIEIMSRGPIPSAFKPFTSSCRLTPPFTMARRLPMSSSTSMPVRGTT